MAVVVAVTLLLCAKAYSDEDFTLPKTKAYLSTCHKAALELHPGQLEQFYFIHKGEKSYFVFVVYTKDGKLWSIRCDSTNGRIVNDQE